MYRTLDDLEGRYAVVPPGEGVSLAEIHNVPPAAPEDMLPGAGISFADLIRTINPAPDAAVWSEASGLPSGPSRRQAPNVAEDVARSTWRGIANEGVAELVGLPDTLSTWGAKGINAASKFVADRLGLEYERPNAAKMREDWPTLVKVAQTVRDFIPTAAGTGKVLKEHVPGADYDPQTTWGEYGKTVGSFVPGALLGPGGTVAKVTNFAVAPGLASEAAGQATKGTAWEPWARGGAALGTLGGAAWLSRRPSGSAATTQEPQAAQSVRQKDEAAASLYPFETAPQRPYKLDYPDGAPASKFGPSVVTMDNDKVVAKRLVGRNEPGGPDVPISEAALYESVHEMTGHPVRVVSAKEMRGKGNNAEYWPDRSEIVVLAGLAPAARYQAVAHEVGHHAHKINPELIRAVVTRPDLLAELMPLYSWGYEGRHVTPLTTPQSMKYKPHEIPQELVSELYRIALTNTNSAKTFAPRSYEFLRKTHNTDENLNKSFQFNSLLGAPGLGALMYPRAQQETGEP